MSGRYDNIRNPNPSIISLTHGLDFLKAGETSVSQNDLTLPVPTVRRDPPRDTPLSQRPKVVTPSIVQPRIIPNRQPIQQVTRSTPARNRIVDIAEGNVDAIMEMIHSPKKPVSESTVKAPTFPKPPPKEALNVQLGTFDESLVTSAAIRMVAITKESTSEIPREEIDAMVSESLKKSVEQYKISFRRELFLYLRKTQTKKSLSKRKPVNGDSNVKTISSKSKKYTVTINSLTARRSNVCFLEYNFSLSNELTDLFCFIMHREGKIVTFQEIMDHFKIAHATTYSKVHSLRAKLGEAHHRLTELITYEKNCCCFNPHPTVILK